MNQKDTTPQLQVLQGSKPEASINQKSSRRLATEKRLATIAIVALAGGALAPHIIRSTESSKSSKDPAHVTRYTEAQLNGLPQDHLTVPSGDGAINVVQEADPTIVATDPGITQELVGYVNDQAPNHDTNPGDPILQAGQQVHVPVVPPKPTH